MALILGDISPRTRNKLIYSYNDIPYKKIWTIDANDNRYIEIIVKLGQKNCGTYSRIAISKDIVILSIVIRRFYCTFNHSLRYPSSDFGVPELDQG
jgi:hypothetical protein